MKFTSVVALLSSVVAVSAADVSSSSTLPATLPELFSQIPACANKCIEEAIPGLCPSVESYWCRCHSSVKSRLVSKTFDCAMEACGGMQEALAYQEATNAVCDNIMEVTVKSQKHIELRAVGSGSVSGSASVSATRSAVRGSGSGSRAMSSATVTAASTATSTLASATGGAATLGSSTGTVVVGAVAGLAIISFVGMLA